MKGAILSKALLVVSIFLFQTSNAIRLEFSAINHFDDIDEVDIKLEAKSSVHGAIAKVKVPHGGKLEWSADVLHYSPNLNFVCSVYIGKGDYEVLLDSFIAFYSTWIGSSWNLPGHTEKRFEWIVDEAGSLLITPPELEIQHSWKNVILIFFITNKFYSQEDLILSIQTAQGIIPSQQIVSHGRNLFGVQKLEANDLRHLELRCSVRLLTPNSGTYAHFKIFDSSWFSETNSVMGIRKFEWLVRENRATMIYPQHHDETYH